VIESVTCPVCGKTSFNPNDVRERYCGNCHMFHDDMWKCRHCDAVFKKQSELHIHNRLRHQVVNDMRRD